MTFEELFTKGGPVVWILAGYSAMALTIVIERYIHFLRMGRASDGVEGARGPEGAVVREIERAASAGVRDLSRVASRVIADELKRMEWGLRTLGVLGNTAPLLGLFGTITGMIKAFMVIEQAGGKVDAQALAGGIWEAMITTGVGLAVAIPVLILLHLLEGRVESRLHAMHRCAGLLLERYPGQGGLRDEPHGPHYESLGDMA
ncbi:MotA/TolQ/ExbB proton channel family protein [Endothiovibrio diazotrophicus]